MINFENQDSNVGYNRIFLLICIIFSFALAFSYDFETRRKIDPCFLCNVQRIACLVIFITASIGYFSKAKKICARLIAIASFLTMGLALYHLGIQYGFFN